MGSCVDESACTFVSSRGLLKSCDVRNPNPVSSSPFLDSTIYGKIKDRQIVYLCTEAILPFFRDYFPTLQCRIVVVSGDSDMTFPNDVFAAHVLENLLNDSRILHWYAQNCTIVHSKVTQIPIGLDYHTVAAGDHPWSPQKTPQQQEAEVLAFSKIQPNLALREQRAYGNFLLNISRGNRKEAFERLPTELIVYEKGFVRRGETWWKQATCAFTISPHGNGLDCHRTWETLALGGIPVVQTSCLDSLYGDLPVLILKDWNEFTGEKMQDFILESQARTVNTDRLYLKFWIDLIKKSCV